MSHYDEYAASVCQLHAAGVYYGRDSHMHLVQVDEIYSWKPCTAMRVEAWAEKAVKDLLRELSDLRLHALKQEALVKTLVEALRKIERVGDGVLSANIARSVIDLAEAKAPGAEGAL